jgi:hypothetical protein
MKIGATIGLEALLCAAATGTMVAGARAQGVPEVVVVPFRGGSGAATTTGTYSGEWWLCVKGGGRAAGTQLSDAFFVFSDASGGILPPPGVLGTNMPNPWHSSLPFNWAFWINDRSAEDLIIPSRMPTLPPSTVPEYNPTHLYLVPIAAPGGTLTFGVGDSYVSDNTGAFVITVGTREQILRCYLEEVLLWTEKGYVWGPVRLPSSEAYVKLEEAARGIEQGNPEAARQQLVAIVQLIERQKGTGIEERFADVLVTAITYLLRVL